MYIPASRQLPEKIEITLYRIFQELVHTIIKHSQATEVLVQLRKMSTHILLVVEGNLQYDSTENEGTTAIVRVPV